MNPTECIETTATRTLHAGTRWASTTSTSAIPVRAEAAPTKASGAGVGVAAQSGRHSLETRRELGDRVHYRRRYALDVRPGTAQVYSIREDREFLPPAQVSAWGIQGPPTLRMDPSLHDWLQAHFWGRAVARVESPDFVHWNITQPAKAPIVMTTDLQDQPGDEAYDMEVFPYEGVYIGLLRIYHNLPEDPTLDVQLTVSRDTVHFTRVGDRSPFLASGPIGSWDRFNQSIPTNSPIPAGDELRFYYSGSTGRHFPYGGKDTAGQEAIGFATIQKGPAFDAQLAAPLIRRSGEEEILTKPVKLTGRTLHVNAKSNFGEILIEVLDGGRTIATSKPVRRDALDIPVEWNGPATMESLKETVVLRITLKNAHLFALWSV